MLRRPTRESCNGRTNSGALFFLFLVNDVCRTVGELVFAALPAFSQDLLSIVLSYTLFGIATLNAQPVSVLSYAVFDKIHIMGCDSLDRVWGNNEHGNLVVLDTTGHRLFTCERPPKSGKSWASAVAFDTNGDVYATVRDQGCICVFSQSGQLQRQFGEYSLNHEKGTLNEPYTIATNGTGLIFVRDKQRSQIQCFRRDGSFVRAGEPNQVSYPGELVCMNSDRGEELYACDDYRVVVQSANDRFSPRFR